MNWIRLEDCAFHSPVLLNATTTSSPAVFLDELDKNRILEFSPQSKSRKLFSYL